MNRKWILFILLVIISISAWNIWADYTADYGEYDFDKAFWEEFDAEHIIENFDKLIESDQFNYIANGNDALPDIRDGLAWPIGDRSEAPQIISVNRFKQYNEINGCSLLWERCDAFGDITPEEAGYKYLYRFYFVTPYGEISGFSQGDSRKECKDNVRENLLWLMSLC